MHSSFVVIWNYADSSVVCRVIRNCSVVCWIIRNSADNSVLCSVIRNCSVVCRVVRLLGKCEFYT
jgi:hypothetical protein